jgi:electron transfer flavoprotein alpha subunit
MEKIGILIETNEGFVKTAMYGVITAAQGPERELYGLVLNGRGSEYKNNLQYYGIQKIVDVQSANGPLKWNPHNWARGIVQVMDRLGINILFGLTSALTKDILPRIAAILDAPLLLDCIRVDLDTLTVEKSQFSGKTIATFRVHGDHYLFGIRPNMIEARPLFCEAENFPIQVQIDNDRLTVHAIKKDPSRKVALSEAEIIISGGRAMQSRKNYQILNECAELMGAAVGASRVAVDAGWVPHSMQVGQTGATVSPKLYIACGISGSVQHLAGMKTSRVIVAINTDPQAAIMRECDYGIVGDLFEVIPILTRKLKAAINSQLIKHKANNNLIN